MSVNKSVIYDKIKGSPDKFKEMYQDIFTQYRGDIHIPDDLDECRVVIVVDGTKEFNQSGDVYLVLVGVYTKESDTYEYEGVYEGYDVTNYQTQEEDTYGDLYNNVVALVSNNLNDEVKPVESRYTESAIDVLNLVHIYTGFTYRHTVGVSMKLDIIDTPEGEQLQFDNVWNVLTENNLIILHIQEEDAPEEQDGVTTQI